ncbi:hypothetical protein N752_16675 [Desulforamulus aquiferis]|nr:hypothetical protein N752_16675 [Desulforamulus aquiferis]
MPIIAGVDIGNSTTEVCLAKVDHGQIYEYLSSSITKTTGIKAPLPMFRGW